MLRHWKLVCLAGSLAACVGPGDEADLYHLPDDAHLDMPADGGDFTFSLADFETLEGELYVSGVACPSGEICDFDFDLGLGLDVERELSPAERAIEEYNLLVEADYRDAGGERRHVTERVSVQRMENGFGLLGGSFTVVGTDVSYKIRPDIDFDLSGPSIRLEGIRFEGRIELCAGLPCPWR